MFPPFQPFGGDETDVESPGSNHVKAENAKSNADHETQLSEDQNRQKKGNDRLVDIKDASNMSPITEPYRSMGEILSSMDHGNHLPVPGLGPGPGKQSSKASGTNFTSKRSTFWGRNNVSSAPAQCILSFQEVYDVGKF